MARLVRIIARLRGPDGCPWDREQTHKSIRQNLIEECYEALEALDAEDPRAFQEELGDLLMQIVFHAQMAAEAGQFDFDAVAGHIADKLVRRHPHVFGGRHLRTSAQVLRQWEEIKQAEKGSGSLLTGLPKHLPALMKADKVQRRVARVGFDWRRAEDVLAKVEEELGELRRALATGRRDRLGEELGDLLFAVVNLARFEQLQAEELLHRCVEKFVGRFQLVEKEVRRRGKRLEECRLEELDSIWEEVKQRKRRPRRGKMARRPQRRAPPA